jgi:hypothetical protein
MVHPLQPMVHPSPDGASVARCTVPRRAPSVVPQCSETGRGYAETGRRTPRCTPRPAARPACGGWTDVQGSSTCGSMARLRVTRARGARQRAQDKEEEPVREKCDDCDGDSNGCCGCCVHCPDELAACGVGEPCNACCKCCEHRAPPVLLEQEQDDDIADMSKDSAGAGAGVRGRSRRSRSRSRSRIINEQGMCVFCGRACARCPHCDCDDCWVCARCSHCDCLQLGPRRTVGDST